MRESFTIVAGQLPLPFEPARAERTLAALEELGFAPPGSFRPLLESTFGNSPFLARLALREHEFLSRLVSKDPAAALEEIGALAGSAVEAGDIAMAMAILRHAKRQAALSIALFDIAGLWTLEEVTRALSRFADACVESALRFLLRERALADGLARRDGAKLAAETGLVVLAMGKYGACELNYSSDIDLVVFYDPARFPFRKRDDARGAAVDLVKGLVRLLDETTSDGYVFRVDLRLRPDAGATQIAISTAAAEAYYEGMGQNWERAAMIKARSCAGDGQAAAEFLKSIEPFIWRRHLDYAAIEDVHSIKRQIHAHGKHGAIAVAGHNIKLGQGGIREIEFFVQTQQLILGGRMPTLRSRRTIEALEALRARDLVSAQVCDELAVAYRFLRQLEHRLQMIEDEQTHTVPKSAEGLAHIACFMGFANAMEFGTALLEHLKIVREHYARLFERAPPLGGAAGSLVFTGVENDPATLHTLAGMGFRDPHHAALAIRGWHHGRIRATRSGRARELLTKLTPALLAALAATVDPDAAFAQFDRFLTRLPAGVQLFSLFLANPDLLKLVASVAGSAPRLAAHLARSPSVLDALFDRGFLGELPSRAKLDAALAEQLSAANDYESILNAARRFAREQIFRVGVQMIQGAVKADRSASAFTDIAESVIAGLASAVRVELAASAGEISGGAFAVVAMGKLGGREMTAGSDLDLIFVYDAPAECETSSGLKSLPLIVYYARLAQRLIVALTALTAEGGLYEVDMRLRPTGNKGPAAVSLESFGRYYRERGAWTWERLALTRARVIAAPDHLRHAIEAEIRAALTTDCDAAQLAKEVREMRDRLATHFSARNEWDLKFASGGLVDIEFMAQYLQLRYGAAAPQILETGTVPALERMKVAGILCEGDAGTLIEAARLQQALTQVLRIAADGPLDPAVATEGLKLLLMRAGGTKDFQLLQSELARAQSGARAIFERLLPAG